MVMASSFLHLESGRVVPIVDDITPITKSENASEVTDLENHNLPTNHEGPLHVVANSSEHPNPERNITTSTAKSKNIKLILEEAAKENQRVRFRITMSTVVVGVTVFIVSVVMSSIFARQTNKKQSILFSVFAALLFPGWAFASYGILPTDVILVRKLIVTIMFLLVLFVPWSVWNTSQYLVIERNQFQHYEQQNDGWSDVRCGTNVPDFGCALMCLKWYAIDVVFFVWVVFLYQNLRRLDGKTIFNWTLTSGQRFQDEFFKVPARAALENFRLSARFVAGSLVIIFTAFTFSLVGVGDRAPWATNDLLIANISQVVSFAITFFIFGHDNHTRVLAFLTSFHTSENSRSASTIAALLGCKHIITYKTNSMQQRNHTTSSLVVFVLCHLSVVFLSLGNIKAKDSLELAKKKFRSISFEYLEEEDFAKNTEALNRTNELHDKSVETKLGCCDVFLSHSWHDDGKKKFAALKRWAEKFKSRHDGREPQIWLDKACIDQTNISRDLMCLPVFLAGCDTLLIIPGPTYTERLWCIMEVFVFLKMGGDIKQITIIPIDVEDENDAKHMFDDADVGKCKCYDEKDKQRLLGIVEEGFGTFEDFNDIIRHVFKQRVNSSIQSYQESFNKRQTHLVSSKKSKRFGNCGRATETQPPANVV